MQNELDKLIARLRHYANTPNNDKQYQPDLLKAVQLLDFMNKEVKK